MSHFKDAHIKSLAEKYQTPFYVYHAEIIHQRYCQLKNAFNNLIEIFYSIKANPNLSICRLLKNMGASAEVCSEFELYGAIKAGFHPDNIIVLGPAKSDRLLKLALNQAVRCIVCESVSEFQRIQYLSKNMGVKAQVMLRINPDFVTKGALLKMGGKPSQFGMDEAMILANTSLFKNNVHVEVIGFHVYNGTRILDHESICQNTESILDLATKLARILNLDLQMVDIGGGFGVPYHEHEAELDLTSIKKRVVKCISEFKQGWPKTKLVLESGRFLVADSGFFVTKIREVKSSKGELFIITDGGSNCHLSAGSSSLLKRNFPIRLVTQNPSSDKTLTSYHITGPLCTPSDLIGKNVSLPPAEENDLIVVERSGAYGPSASPIHFLSHGHPSEILIKNHQSHLIRMRDNEHDIFKNHILIN